MGGLIFYRWIICGFLLFGVTAAPLWGQTSHSNSVPAASPAVEEGDWSTLAGALEGSELAQRGFNASVGFSVAHDSQLGWSSFALPGASYRFNPTFSMNASIPVYFDINGYTYVNNKPVSPNLRTHYGQPGDTIIAGHAQFSPGWFDSTTTAAIGAPTGNAKYGLGTGRITYAAMNDFAKTLGSFTPDLELGFGDSSELFNGSVQRNYDTLGLLTYLQGGSGYALPWGVHLESDLYDQVPVGSQKVYTNVLRKKKYVPLQPNLSAADNGLTVSMDLPEKHHLWLSSYFNRSFRLADSTVGVTLTYDWKAPETDTGMDF